MRPVLIVFALFIFSGISHAGQNVVIYPVYHNDTDRVIQEILDGLRDQLGGVTGIAVDTELDNNVIRNRVASLADEDVVIALTGDMGVFARSSGFKGRLIEGVSGGGDNATPAVRIGIQPSPEKYIRTLKKIHSGVDRLFYFHSDAQSDMELIGMRSIANTLGIEVEIIAVDDINDAMNKINDVFKQSNANTDAVWIPYHFLSMANNIMLKFVLSESWRRSLIVYTDSLDAVVRGLLFTLTPDYYAYGKYLGNYAKGMNTGREFPEPEDIPYFDDAYLMINQRFSVHIGLNINRSSLGKYKIVVPAK